jgi:hypothetical protein
VPAKMACGHRLERVPHSLVTNHYQRRARRRLKNFSRNRPETTNLNHQYAIRRVDICRILDAPSGLASWIAPKPETGCDMVHIGGAQAPAGRIGQVCRTAESCRAIALRRPPRLAIGSHPPAPEARRRRSRPGCPAPITRPIAIDIAICAAMTFAATATMTDYTGKDISVEINHGDIRFTAIVSLR